MNQEIEHRHRCQVCHKKVVCFIYGWVDDKFRCANCLDKYMKEEKELEAKLKHDNIQKRDELL